MQDTNLELVWATSEIYHKGKCALCASATKLGGLRSARKWALIGFVASVVLWVVGRELWSGSPFVESMFAAGDRFGFTAIEILVGVVAGRALWGTIRNALVGRKVRVFFDEHGREHVHQKPPIQVGGADSHHHRFVIGVEGFRQALQREVSGSNEEGDSSLADYLVQNDTWLELRVGGWFRKNLVMTRGADASYYIWPLDGWDGTDLALRSGYSRRGFTGLSWQEVLGYVEEFKYDTGQHDLPALDTIRRLRAACRGLIFDALDLRDEMAGGVDGAKNSPHGRRARAAVEQMLVLVLGVEKSGHLADISCAALNRLMNEPQPIEAAVECQNCGWFNRLGTGVCWCGEPAPRVLTGSPFEFAAEVVTRDATQGPCGERGRNLWERVVSLRSPHGNNRHGRQTHRVTIRRDPRQP